MIARRPSESLWKNNYYSSYSRYGVYNDENGDLVFNLEVPGLGKEDVSISLTPEDGLLEIETPEKTLKRTVSENYSLEDAFATLENGLLEIKFPLRKKNQIQLAIH